MACEEAVAGVQRMPSDTRLEPHEAISAAPSVELTSI